MFLVFTSCFIFFFLSFAPIVLFCTFMLPSFFHSCFIYIYIYIYIGTFYCFKPESSTSHHVCQHSVTAFVYDVNATEPRAHNSAQTRYTLWEWSIAKQSLTLFMWQVKKKKAKKRPKMKKMVM